MFLIICKRFIPSVMRRFPTRHSRGFKVAVIGAAGSNGQPLCLLLGMSPIVTKLAVLDTFQAKGVGVDLSHIDSPCDVISYEGSAKMPEGLKDSHLVVIAAGLPRSPNMTREQQFDGNAEIIKTVSECISECCPKACIVIVSNPVNSLLPIVAKVLQKSSIYDPRRLFGASNIDVMRARKFIGDLLKVDPRIVSVPVIGGHSAATIVPIISQSQPPFNAPHEKIVELIDKIVNAGTAVVKAKDSIKCASLSMAFTTYNLIISILKGLSGKELTKEFSYVPSDICGTKFFASEVIMGKNGIERICELPKMNEYEKGLLCNALDALKNEIKKGEDFIK